MKKNGVAKILSGVGILTIVVGIFASAVISALALNLIILIGGAIISGIAGVILIGFAEIIDLLQEHLNEQIELRKDFVAQTKVLIKLNESVEALNENSNQKNTK